MTAPAALLMVAGALAVHLFMLRMTAKTLDPGGANVLRLSSGGILIVAIVLAGVTFLGDGTLVSLFDSVLEPGS